MKNTVGLCCGCGYIRTIVYKNSSETPTGLCGKCLSKELTGSNDPKIVALAKLAIQKPIIARILV